MLHYFKKELFLRINHQVMKNISLLLIILFSFAMNGFSQTKKISHRSHSGKDATLIMDDEDNFGLPPAKKNAKTKTSAALDTTSKQKDAVDTKMKVKPRKKKVKQK